MSTSDHLKTTGWGPVRLPGERARIERITHHVRELLDPRGTVTPAVADDSRLTERAPDGGLGERKLYLVPDGPLMNGPDVHELQRRLVQLGYREIESVDGVFDPTTHQALVRFQNDYGVFTDGVCARVTVLVLNYLENLGVTATNPATDKQKRLIYWSVSAQRSGMVLVGSPDPGAEDSAEWAILERLGPLVEESIEQDAHMQTLPMPSVPSAEERIRFADSIKAEVVVLLDVRRDEDGPAGIQTHYFSRAGADSDVGAPLAVYIGEETARQTGATYLGATAEDSELLMSPQAPTVRVTVGNIRHSQDARRLTEFTYLKKISKGIAQGLTRLYLLGARHAPEGSAPVSPLSRRQPE